jgi:ADP-ribosylglycohydrolase
MCPIATMATIPAVEQFHGSLLGLALGDALGAAVEAFPPGVAALYAERLGREELPARGPGGWAFGQVTDDTQLSQLLLECIADSGSFDPAVFAARLLAFVESGRLVGGGPATTGAARQLARGVPWHECGMPSPYAGNGAAMRAAPLGVLYRHDPRRLTRVVVDQARVTHHDSRAIAGAVAVAWASAIASRRDPIVPGDFLGEVAEAVEAVDSGFSETLRAIAPWVKLSPAAAAASLVEQGLEPEALAGWQGISSFVVSSVCWSLLSFLRHPDDWWEAVRGAIAVGGDTDTLASMTGAIAGARSGEAALPPRLLTHLSDAGQGVADGLRRLAERLRQLAHHGESGS